VFDLSKLNLKAAGVQALWLLSFLGSFMMLPLSDGIEVAIVISMLSFAIGYAFYMGKGEFKYNALTGLVLLLWGVAAVSVGMSEVRFVALTYFFFFSAFPMTFLLFHMVDASSLLKWIRPVILCLGIASIIQFYFIPQMLKFGGTHWPFEDSNSLAIILASGILLYLAEVFKSGKIISFQTVGALALFAGLVTTASVAALLAFILVACVLSILLNCGRAYRAAGAFIVGALLLYALISSPQVGLLHSIESAPSAIGSFVSAGVDEPNRLSWTRFMIWKSAFHIFEQHSFTGTGIGTFFLYYPEFRNIKEDSAGYMAHNDLVQIAAEMGLLAPIIALLLVGFVIFKTISTLKSRADLNEKIDLLLPFAIFGLIIGHSLVNFNLYILPTLMMIGFFLALWNAQMPNKIMTSPSSRAVREGTAFCGIMIALIPLWGCSLSEYYTNRAIDALGHEDIQEFSNDLNNADTWGMGQNARAIVQAAKFSVATNDVPRALSLLGRAEAVNPRLVQIYIERAQILLPNDADKALLSAQYALRLDAGSIPARMMVADVLESLGRHEDAYAVLKAGMDGVMRYRDPAPYYQRIANMSLEHGDFEIQKQALLALKNLK